jgi:hypothetical protein
LPLLRPAPQPAKHPVVSYPVHFPPDAVSIDNDVALAVELHHVGIRGERCVEAERAGIEIDWENMRATVDGINRRNEECEAMAWPAADPSQYIDSMNEEVKQSA